MSFQQDPGQTWWPHGHAWAAGQGGCPLTTGRRDFRQDPPSALLFHPICSLWQQSHAFIEKKKKLGQKSEKQNCTQKHVNPQIKFPSVLGNTLPLPDGEREGAMPALDLWKSLGAKSLHCSITGFRLVISCFLTLSTPWKGEKKKKKELINNWNSSLVNHCAKLTRLIKCLQFQSAGAKWQRKHHLCKDAYTQEIFYISSKATQQFWSHSLDS